MRPKNKFTFPPARNEDTNRPTVVVDSMGLAYAAKYTYAKLTHKGSSTAVIYGMPSMVRTLITTHKPGKLILVWDGQRDPVRMRLCKKYKSHRPEKEKEFTDQILKVRKFFHYLGLPQAYSPEVEGDDMVYKVVKKEKLLNKVIIISGDKDFSQLIDRDVKIWNPRTKLPLSYHTFKMDHNCEGNQFVDYLCLLGDDSDDISGIPGIGPARARKFLDIYGSIKAYLESNDDYPGLLDKESLAKKYKRNRRMIDLALFDRKYNSEKKITWYLNESNPTFNEAKVRKLCYEYNLKTYLDPRFQSIFKNL